MLPTARERTTGMRTASDLRREMDRLFDNMFGTQTRDWSTWRPAADLVETDEGFTLDLELPGFRRDDIEVTVEQGILTISGERARTRREDVTYHLNERAAGRFSRSFSLPNSVNPDDVAAEFHDGVLHVELPKAAEAKPRKIEVDVG